MTKIVYNRRYGGFGLSPTGIQRYLELKGLTHTLHRDLDCPSCTYFINEAGEEFEDRNIPRSDPHLIQVIEELGPEASGDFASLAIRDLPPGTRYYIHDYDGNESIITEAEHEWSIA